MLASTVARIFCATLSLFLLVGLPLPTWANAPTWASSDASTPKQTATLEVQLDGTTRFPDASWKLFLQPMDAREGEPFDAAQLGRQLDAETLATGHVQWPALPPGNYRLLLKPLVAVTEAVPPQEVAILELEAGQTRQLRVDLEAVLRRSGVVSALPVSPQPGAVLTVRLQHAERQQLAAGILVELFPEADWGSAAEAIYQGKTWPAIATGVTNEQGWVRLVGLPAGRFVLGMRPEGRTPQRESTTSEGVARFQGAVFHGALFRGALFQGAIELVVGRETLLQDLDLPQPAALEVSVASGRLAALDVMEVALELEAYLDPGCGRLRHAVYTRSGFQWDEVVRLDAVPPGEWLIVVKAKGPPGTFLEVARESVVVESAEARLVWLEAEGAFYRGRVLRGEEPVRARVDLVPQEDIDGASTPRAYADPEGFFVVGLPEAGVYAPQLTLSPDRPPVHLPPVAFSDPNETVELVLPEGSLSGQVVDVNGLPVSDAAVVAVPLAGQEAAHQEEGRKESWLSSMLAGEKVSETGHFELTDLPAGKWSLQAVSQANPELRSVRRQVEIVDKGIAGIRLVLAPGRSIGGRLAWASGAPIAGARLRLVGEHEGRLQDYPELRTDAAGSFQATLEPTSSHDQSCYFHLQLLEPSLPKAAWWLPCGPSLDLGLPDGGGALVHPGEETWRQPVAGFLVSETGGFLPLGLVATEVPPVGAAQPLRIPRLASGQWKLVTIQPSAQPDLWMALLRGQGHLLPGPVVQIAPGMTTQIHME